MEEGRGRVTCCHELRSRQEEHCLTDAMYISSVVAINPTSLFPSSFPPSSLPPSLLPHSHRPLSLNLSPGPLRKGHQNPSQPHRDLQTPSVLYCNWSGIFYFMSAIGFSPFYIVMAFLCGKLLSQYGSLSVNHTQIYSHEINFHEINSHVVNSYKINQEINFN